LTDLLPLALAAATPLLLAVFGELVVQRSGMINLGIEGMMLTAAATAVVVAQRTGSAWLGLIGGVAGAAVLVAIYGVASIHLAADQVVTGTAVNLFALGATGFAYRALQESGVFFRDVPRLHGFPGFGFLARLPIAGPALFAQDALIPFAWIAVPMATGLLIWRSRFGLRLRASGENPAAVRANGSSVAAHRWSALGIEAILVGVAGGYLSLALSSGFAENMVSGRGYIALAIVTFGRWRVRGALAGSAVFGLAAAAQYALQAASSDVSFHLLLALPYAVTIAILCGLTGAVRAPAALGKPDIAE
jgi:general nucleoside transport system permease protein